MTTKTETGDHASGGLSRMTDRALEIAIQETRARIVSQHAHLDQFVTRIAGECFLMVLRAQSELASKAITMFERGNEPMVGHVHSATTKPERDR